MRHAFALLALVSLGGCLPENSGDLAACRTEADRFYQGYVAADVDSPRSQYIIGCMAAKGYEFTVAPEDCNSLHPLPTQSTCYTPGGWWAWINYKLREQLK
jgi:hypothetical protein